MRALTLTQPWAGLVASGIKLIENRPRHIVKREDFGKPFAIHASREIDEGVYPRIRELAPELFDGSVDVECHACFANPGWACEGAEFGYHAAGYHDVRTSWYHLSRITSAIIAVATIADAMYIGGCNEETITKACERAGVPDQRRWTFGPTVYVLRDIRALKTPVPCRGWQGFWTLTDEQTALVERPLDANA